MHVIDSLLYDCLDKLHERQRDPDEKARQEVVVTICEAASGNIDAVTDQVGNYPTISFSKCPFNIVCLLILVS